MKVKTLIWDLITSRALKHESQNIVMGPDNLVWYGMVWGTRDGDPLGGLVLVSRESFLRYHCRRPRAQQPAGHTEVG